VRGWSNPFPPVGGWRPTGLGSYVTLARADRISYELVKGGKPLDKVANIESKSGRRVSGRTHSVRGVTLIELLITVSIVAILLAFAVPNLREFFVANRIGSASNEFVAALATARSEAIRRGANVRITNLQLTSAEWSNGWHICADLPASPAPTEVQRNQACKDKDENLEQTIRTGAPAGNLTTLYATFATGVVVFDAQGRVTSTPGMFVVCYDSTTFAQSGRARSRAILVNAAGRVRLAVDTNGNGVPEGDAGADITGSCTAPVA